MTSPQRINDTIALLKREKDLAWLFETLPDWKLFQLVSLVVSHYQRAGGRQQEREDGDA